MRYFRWLISNSATSLVRRVIAHVAVPTGNDLRLWGAKILLDHTGEFGRAVAAEVEYRQQLRRARAAGEALRRARRQWGCP